MDVKKNDMVREKRGKNSEDEWETGVTAHVSTTPPQHQVQERKRGKTLDTCTGAESPVRYTVVTASSCSRGKGRARVVLLEKLASRRKTEQEIPAILRVGVGG